MHFETHFKTHWLKTMILKPEEDQKRLNIKLKNPTIILVSQYMSVFCDHYIRSQIDGTSDDRQRWAEWIWTESGHPADDSAARFHCQDIFFLWGNSQHVCCRDHFTQPTHQTDCWYRMIFTDTQFIPSDNILKHWQPTFFFKCSYNICLF